MLNALARLAIIELARSARTIRQSPAPTTYAEHLRSPYWRQARAMAFARAGHKCQLCSRRDSLEAHHNTYAHFGHEQEHLEDLTVLCDGCHRAFHSLRRVA